MSKKVVLLLKSFYIPVAKIMKTYRKILMHF